MPKIVFLDTYYPQVFNKLPKAYSYEQRVEQLNSLLFGTSFFYSAAFKKMGWQAEDVVVNDPWFPSHDSAFGWILASEPDVIYCQDLSWLTDSDISIIKDQKIKLVAQHSCPWAGNDRISKFDLIFSSFPHYLPRIQQLGPQAEFLPIAFGEQVLDYVEPISRDIDITFVGGVGGGAFGSGHWNKGTELLETVARSFGERFHWYGYGIGNLPHLSALRNCWRGEAWGIDQYKVYARSKIVINRHGEVAEGYTNNMRCFEATGMGALLLTEESKNLDYYFNKYTECLAYKDTADCVDWIENILSDYRNEESPFAEAEPIGIAAAGQARTLKDHTYTKRLEDAEPHIRRLLK